MLTVRIQNMIVAYWSGCLAVLAALGHHGLLTCFFFSAAFCCYWWDDTL